MGRKRIYKTSAEKQKAFRLRHGQKRKVPIEIRRGQKLGSQEGDLRPKKEGETWEEYHEYILKSTEAARKREEKAGTAVAKTWGAGAKRIVTDGKEPELTEEYYEVQRKKEEGFAKLGKGRKVRKRKTVK